MSKATQKYLASLVLFGSNGIVASMIDLPSLFIVLARVSLGAALLVALVALSRSARTNLQAPMLFKTRLTAQKVLGFAAVTVGAFLVVGQGLGEGVSPWGLFLGAMSAVMYAVMVIFSKKVTQIGGVECSAIQLCGSLAAVAVYLGFSAATGSIKLPSATMLAHLNVPAALCIGLVNTGLGCYMYFSSMGELPVTRVAVCGYLEPLSAVVLSALLLGEAMTPANVLGAALILGGAIYSELGEKLRLRATSHRMATA